VEGKAVWKASKAEIDNTRLSAFMRKLGFSDYDLFYKQSLMDIAWFWDEVVKDMKIDWFEPYHEILNLSKGIKWPSWFAGGRLNVTHNAVDKWMNHPSVGQRAAIVWEGEDGKVKKYSYRDLALWVNRVANGLREQGIEKGDRISLYLPMIPETVVAILAIAKIGAIFTPAFSGYGADAVAKRLDSAGAKMMITADGFYRRGKIVPMKEEADKAVNSVACVEKVVVVRRIGRDIPWTDNRDVDWSELEKDADFVSAESMKSDDPFMLIYTSGTTGRPKGIIHTHSGFPIKAAFDAGYGMDLKDGEVLFWLTDMGWMMGPFLVFGALLNAGTMLIYEGSPDYPEPGRLWKLAEDHGVTHMGVSPTLVRSLMKHGESWFKDRDLSRLRAFGSTGEPWNPEPWFWLFNQVGHGRIPIFNYSGGTEISGGILGNVFHKPIAPTGFNSPLPGMDADVYSAEGKPIRGGVGELVIKQPWVGMASGFWQEPERYEETYWSRWPDTWVHGDWAEIDEEGFWYITGRSDDTLNIAGKRLGPAEMESILVEHPIVVEAGIVGIPDELKGEAAVCFVVLRPGELPTPELSAELINLVGERLGKALKPKAIHFVDDLPKTRNAKIMRRVIRAAYLGVDPGDLSALENPDTVEAIRQMASNRVKSENS
jgi:acetyl-CoA synthetase